MRRYGVSRMGGPTRRQSPPAQTTASPESIGGIGVRSRVPSASFRTLKARVKPDQSKTRWSPLISYVPE